MVVGAIVGKTNKPKAAETGVEQAPDAGKGKPKRKATSTRLYDDHSQKLSDLAHEENLKGGSAEAFEKHFGDLLENLLIAAKERNLQKLRDQKRSGT